MASLEVDPTAFNDWEEAFLHPLSATREFEKTLRSHAEENRQKLRTIVGASYRDLLGTADRILEMDVQIRLVGHNLGSMGQKSNSRAVERIFANCARFDAERNFQSMSLWKAGTSLTDNCSRTIAVFLGIANDGVTKMLRSAPTFDQV